MVKHLARWTQASAMLGALLVAGCGGGGAETVALTGAGATFPYPVYSKWFDSFFQSTGHQINYQSVGSGAGVKQYSERTVDFGATDGPMTDAEIAAVNGEVLHIPTVLGAVVLTWNLPQIGNTQLTFDGATIAAIFMGQITKWNDPRIAALNPGVTLPDRDLMVVHRSDGSGTTFIFTDYLGRVSGEWQSGPGVGKAINWPVGLGGKGNEGVTQQVKQLEGTIGYVELIYAVENDLPVAKVVNAAGNAIAPSLESVSAAAAGIDLPADTDFRVSIANAAGADAYPISSFTWLLIRPTHEEAAKGAAIKQFLTWMVTDEAQGQAAALHYAPLPASVRTLVEAKIATL
jgi:phosphate transport system substrate-binding protein